MISVNISKQWRTFVHLNSCMHKHPKWQVWPGLKYRLDIALKTEGRISQDLDITWQVLEAHVLHLLKIAGQAMEDWIQGGVKTELYLNRSKEIKLTNLQRRKMEIFRHLVLRKKEWNGLIGF